MVDTVEIQPDVHRGIVHRGKYPVIPAGRGPANFASGQLDYFEVRATNGARQGKDFLQFKLGQTGKQVQLPAHDPMYLVIGRIHVGTAAVGLLETILTSVKSSGEAASGAAAVAAAAGIASTAATGGISLGVYAIAVGLGYAQHKKNQAPFKAYIARLGTKPFAYKGEKIYDVIELPAVGKSGVIVPLKALAYDRVRLAFG